MGINDMLREGTVRLGVIGLGKIAERAHLPGFAEARGAKLIAVSSSRPRAAHAMQERYAIPQYFQDWQELCASDALDAVAICTPNDTHASIARVALSQGKHVLLEKPITSAGKDARGLLALAARSKRVLHVHHNLRFHAAALLAKTVIEQGRLGRIVAFEATLAHRGPKHWAPRARWFYDPARVGGGVLMDLGVHAFDLLRFWIGDEASSVSANGRLVGRGKHAAEHHAACSLALARGAVGTVNVSWLDATYRNRYYLMGERASLSVDLATGSVDIQRAGKASRLASKASRGPVPSAQREFVQAILGSQQRPLRAASGEDGTRALDIALAAQASCRAGKRVELFREK